MLSLLSCTSGIISDQKDPCCVPRELSKNAIFALSFHELETIKPQLFAL